MHSTIPFTSTPTHLHAHGHLPSLKYPYTCPILQGSDTLHPVSLYLIFSLILIILRGTSILPLSYAPANYAIAKVTTKVTMGHSIPVTWLLNDGVPLSNEWLRLVSFSMDY